VLPDGKTIEHAFKTLPAGGLFGMLKKASVLTEYLLASTFQGTDRGFLKLVCIRA
jgi:hypothetical protein